MKGNRWLWLLLLCAPLAIGQGIYKWTDEKGEVHYGEAPPEGAQSSEVTIKNNSPSNSGFEGAPPAQNHEEATQRLLRTFEEERSKKQEAESKQAEEEKKRKANCLIARDRLRNVKEAGALYKLDKNGERHIYGDEERAAAERRAEADVTKYCK